MDNYIDEFYKVLIRNYGFYMNEYKSTYKNKKMYLAIKELEGGSYAVIITNDKEENIDYYEAVQYLRERGKKFSINTVIFAHNNYINSNEENTNKLVINEEGQVILCSEKCRPLMNIFLNIGNHNMETVKKVSLYNAIKKDIPTTVLISINVIVFLLSAFLSGSLFDIHSIVLLFLGAKYTPYIDAGQYYRLFTCMFLHGGIIHLACNMYSLYIVGPQIKQIYGSFKYLILYFCGGIISSIISCIFSPDSISVGASGAIFALVGGLLSFAVSERKNINKKYISGLIQVIVLNLFIGFSMSSIDNSAHIGGLMGGFILGLLLYNINKSRRSYEN